MLEDTSKVRKFPRHKGLQRAFVLINQGIDALPFHIVDVSKGGLAFRYLGPRLKRPSTVKIDLYHESELIVEGLTVKPVSDYCLQKNLIQQRRGSFRFNSLNSEQNALLEKFINHFTDQAVPAA